MAARRRLRRRTTAGATFSYAAAWLAAGLAVAVAVVLLMESDGDTVTLPPVRQISLEEAVATGRCDLWRHRPGATEREAAAATAPARAGVYDEPVEPAALTAALRTGVIAIEYQPRLAGSDVDRLAGLHGALPRATIVAPAAARSPAAVTARAWRRTLACPRLTAVAIDAIRLFRGRFVGAARGTE